MGRNKKLIIISIIAMLAIVSAVLVYLFMATDVFRSDKELFQKYISQNTQSLQKITNFQTTEIYKNLKNENKYESSTNLKLFHSEGGEVSSPLNNLSAKLDIQKDDEEQYMYADAQILYANEEYLETEIIKEQDLYGIRFSDVAKQFVMIKEDTNFDTVANNIGIDSEQLKNIMNFIDGKTEMNEIISSEEIDVLKTKYLNIIINTISQGTFGSLKNAMITYNNQTIKANEYSVQLSSEQVDSLLIEILNNIKTESTILEKIQDLVNVEEFEKIVDGMIKIIAEEKEMPSIKIKVYEQDKRTIRTIVEIDSNRIILENVEENTQVKTKLQFSRLNQEQIIEYNIEISKNNTDNKEEFNITIQTVDEQGEYTIGLLNNMIIENNDITFKSSISYKKDILSIEGILENVIKIGKDFDKKQTLEQTNNVVLNNLENERQQSIINILKEKVPEKVEIRLDLLGIALGIKETEADGVVAEDEMSRTDINKFNARFEFYTGDAVSYENVKTLLQIVKNNIAGYEMIPVINEGEENLEENEKYNIKLYIEQNKQNEETINKVLEKISEQKKYNVSISYKETNGLIDYITINEVEN